LENLGGLTLRQMNILVIGLGYVGLTTALGLAEKGHKVSGLDKSGKLTTELSIGHVSISEPSLSEALTRHQGIGFTVLSASPTDLRGFDAIFICVGTPCDHTGSTDLRPIFSALEMLTVRLKAFKGIIIIKSTVPPNTTKTKILPYLRSAGITAPVANNPEFLRETHCWDDFMNPDRIVCGAEDDAARDLLKSIYKDFDAPVIFTSMNTAEFIKYLSNNMLASMISFSNEMSMIANAIGDISIKQAFEVLHLDKRWADNNMKSYVYPGCGFGGDCLPKDLQSMISHAKSHGVNPAVLESVQAVNASMTSYIAEQVTADITESIGILGLAFKPNSSDVRFSPAAAIITALLDKGYSSIYAFDPKANAEFSHKYDFEINFCDNADEVCIHAKTVIITTAWQQFKGIDKQYPEVKFIDGRYLL
jgi:UDPglucose 6-dehydrogenase